jgi:transposase
MGARTTESALTENRDGTVPAGMLYVGIDIGRRSHMVAAIPRQRMEDGSWERASARRFAAMGSGYRELADWLSGSGLEPNQIQVGLEPTGGWYSQTAAAWLMRGGYQLSWLQNAALHERRQLAIGKQTKTDALDARLIARLLYERDCLGNQRGFLHRAPRSADALRLLVRNRTKLVEEQTRYRLQLTAILDVLFPELKGFFRGSITGQVVRHLLEAYPTPQRIADAAPTDLYDVVVRRGRARRHADRMEELQGLAAASAGLVDDIAPILKAQTWLLSQLNLVDEQIANIEKALADALECWPPGDLQVLNSLPGMTTLRQAVLLSAMGDIATFQSDRQLRKLLGWYPEAKESGTSVFKHRLGQSGNRLARREIWLWVMFLISPKSQATPFRTFYKRLRVRGVSGRTAIGHVAGKLISVLFHCLRSSELYDIERHARDLGRGEALPGFEA